MRLVGVALLLLGLVASVLGGFSGCGRLFTWNGKHPIEVKTLSEGLTTSTLLPEPGRRYTLSVQVAFDREGQNRSEGVVVVEAKMPIVVRVKDSAGTLLTETSGWLDPNEPPNVLFGQSARESTRGPMPELVVERLVPPFTASSAARLSIEVNLGPDRVGSASVVARRLIIHDDALPGSIRNAFVLAGAGIVAFVSGLVLVLMGWFRRRRPKRAKTNPSSKKEPRATGKHGGNPHHDVV